MKLILTFLVIVMSSLAINAQYVYNDFDANQNEEFSGWPNAPVIVANPDASGINTSANVAQFDKTDYAQWDHAYAILNGKVDFTTSTTFSLKVYSPITCDVVFKLEDKTNSGIFVEKSQSITSIDTWVQLDFDFTGEASNTYDKLVIFFDFATFNANTFYFDDVEGPEYDDGVEPQATLELPITFDVDTAEYDLIDFGGNISEIIVDPDDANNHIVKTIKQETAELWAGTTVGGSLGLATPLPFTPDSTVMSVMVWSPDAGIPVRLKAEDATNGGISVETEAVTTVAGDWETLQFNFANPAPGTPPINFDNEYNKLSIFFNFGTTGADAGEQTYYWDDIYWVGPGPPPTIELPITFDVDTADYDLIDFGGNISQIIEDPDDPNNKIVESIKQETAELWAGTTVAGTLGLVQPLPFAPDSTHMSVRVWSPAAGIPVRFKAENISDAGIYVENEVFTSIAMDWDTLIFNFANPVPGTPAINFALEYSKLSIFFNFGTTGADAGEQTYYWDDVYWIGALPPKPLVELDVQDNFEDDGWGTIDEWFFQDPDLVALTITTDPEDQNNNVVDYNRSGTFQWTNAQFILEHRMDLTERNEFELGVYLPSSNDYSGDLNPTAAIKLQNSKLGGNAWQTQTEVLITVDDYDQWVTLLFDFSAVADSVNYDQVVIQMGGEGHFVPGQFYFDNLYLKHIPYITIETPNGGEEIEQNSSFMINWDYNYWEGDIDIEFVREGENPEAIVLNLPASDSVYEWLVPYNQDPGEDYKVIITSLNNSFPTDTSDAYFSIVEVDGVQANFSADNNAIYEGESVTFTDLSSGDPDTWEWYFEGGTPETFDGQTPPEIIYDTEGTYDVQLTVYNGNDQDVTLKEDYIQVDMEVVDLTPPNSLQAFVGLDYDVQLSWNAPGINELIYDNNTTTGSYSYEGYTMATHMSPEGSCKVLTLKYYTTIDDGDNTFDATLFEWDGTQPGTDVVYTEPATAEDGMWVLVDVSGQDINFTGDFVVGFGSINATTYVGYDGDLDNGRSWDFDNDALWEQWNEAYLIRAVVEYADGKIAEIGNTTSKPNSQIKEAVNSAHSSDYSGLKFKDPISNQNTQYRNLLGYNVYRDDVKINENVVLATDYNDQAPPIGSHDYYVTAVYEAGESEPSNVASIVITDIAEKSDISIAIYPNPTDGIFTLELPQDEIFDLAVFDITGKIVYSNVMTATTRINVSDWKKGIYFLQIQNNSTKQTVFKKLVLK